MTDENKSLISLESKGAYLVLNLFGLKLRIRKINRFEIKIKYNYLLKELKIKTGLGFQDYTQNTIIMFMMMFNKYRDEFKKSFELIIKAEDYIPKSNKKYLGYGIFCDDKKSMYIPDPTFYSWVNCGCESFKDYAEKIESEGGGKPLYDKIFWIGNIDVHPIRKKLVELANENEHFEFISMSWNTNEREGKRFKATKYVSLPDHCKYKYLLDIRGNGWSGRLKFLLYTQRPVFYVERNLKDYSIEGLEPFVHYIPVKEDLSDLEEKYQWAQSHPKECQKIAQNALAFAKKKYDYDNILSEYKEIVLKFINEK